MIMVQLSRASLESPAAHPLMPRTAWVVGPARVLVSVTRLNGKVIGPDATPTAFKPFGREIDNADDEQHECGHRAGRFNDGLTTLWPGSEHERDRAASLQSNEISNHRNVLRAPADNVSDPPGIVLASQGVAGVKLDVAVIPSASPSTMVERVFVVDDEPL
jgi:hypothetical protein